MALCVLQEAAVLFLCLFLEGGKGGSWLETTAGFSFLSGSHRGTLVWFLLLFGLGGWRRIAASFLEAKHQPEVCGHCSSCYSPRWRGDQDEAVSPSPALVLL